MLVDPVGSVDLVDAATYAVSRVDFAGLAATDADLAAKGVDQLLSLASMTTYLKDARLVPLHAGDALDWDDGDRLRQPPGELAVVAVDAATATAATLRPAEELGGDRSTP